jgi:hypothetical protein
MQVESEGKRGCARRTHACAHARPVPCAAAALTPAAAGPSPRAPRPRGPTVHLHGDAHQPRRPRPQVVDHDQHQGHVPQQGLPRPGAGPPPGGAAAPPPRRRPAVGGAGGSAARRAVPVGTPAPGRGAAPAGRAAAPALHATVVAANHVRAPAARAQVRDLVWASGPGGRVRLSWSYPDKGVCVQSYYVYRRGPRPRSCARLLG